MKVYKQASQGECGNYAALLCLDKIGNTSMTEEKILKYPPLLNGMRAAKMLVDEGIIARYIKLRSERQVDMYLKAGYYLFGRSAQVSFEQNKVSPYIQTFESDKNHCFTIIEDLGNKWKIQDSQGEKFGDKGCWYMYKKDFVEFSFGVYIFVSNEHRNKYK